MRDDKVWSRFPLTRAAIEHGWYPLDDDDDEPEPQLGHSLLRSLAAESGGAIREVRPGMWWCGRADDEPPAS